MSRSMAYSVEFKNVARKAIAKLPQDIKNRVISASMDLADNPRPTGCKKLKSCDIYRIRVGDYRILYEIHDNVLVILVVRVAHRKDVYQ